MIVTCEKCSSRFRLADDKVGPGGVKVRCSKCQHTFTAKKAPEPLAVDDDMVVEVEAPAEPGLKEISMVGPPPTPGGAGMGEWRPGMPAGKPPVADAGGDALPSDPAADVNFSDDIDPHEAETAVGPNPTLFDDDTEPAAGPEFGAATVEISAAAAMAAIEKSKQEGGDPEDDPFARPTVAPDAADLAQLEDEGGLEIDFDDISDVDGPEEQGNLAEGDLFGGPSGSGAIPEGDPFAAGGAGAGADGAFGDDLFSDLPDEPSAPSAPFDGEPSIGLARRPKSVPVLAVDKFTENAPTGVAGKLFLIVNYAITGILVLVLLAGIFYFITGAQVAERGRPRVVDHVKSEIEGVKLASMRSVTYPTRSGHDVLVVQGEVENGTTVKQEHLWIEAKLSNNGRALGSSRAPLGVVLGPLEINELSNAASIQAAIIAKARLTESLALPAGGTAIYTVVVPDPPRDMSQVTQAVTLRKGEALKIPEPVVEEPPPPDEEEIKGKKKKKKKKKKRKKKKKEE